MADTDSHLTLGRRGEDAAAALLAQRGYTVLARNWRIRTPEVRGELDLLCLDDGALVVVEVKTRRSTRAGSALDAITPAKQAQVRRLALAFLRDSDLRVTSIRFDVVAVEVRGADVALCHLEGAF